MSGIWGKNVKISIFGESHGVAIGITIDGLPAGIELDLDYINLEMQRRAPGKNSISTPRKEGDQFEILSGFFKGKTTGTPLCSIIRNSNQKSRDYDHIKSIMRPSHGDFPGHIKYDGHNDYRGGGHFSGRITAPLVFAGAVAKHILEKQGVLVASHIKAIENVEAKGPDYTNIDRQTMEKIRHKKFPVIDDAKGEEMVEAIHAARKDGDSVGGVIEGFVLDIDPGLGSPFFHSIESRLSHALFSIPGVKGIEFGLGFDISKLRGSQANDEYYIEDSVIKTHTNNNGGVTGGITNGMPIVFRVAMKPTPSISKSQRTVDISTMENTEVEVHGRHDPCIVQRAVPVVEAACALTILDFFLRKGEDLMEELDLGKIRDEIDDIDRELVRLFELRMDTVIKVAKYKEKNNQPVLDKSREVLVIDKAKSFLKDEHYNQPVEEFFENLMAISRKLQAQLIFSGQDQEKLEEKPKEEGQIQNEISKSASSPKKDNIKVCYQGVPGAFSESALVSYFGEDTDRVNVEDFEDVFRTLKDEECDYGILPIENSSTGGISEVSDLLRKYGLYIVGEKSIKIDQNLLALKDAEITDIKEVYSHPQGLGQSSEFLKSNKSLTPMPYRNTAESAKFVSESDDKSKAAIASIRAAELYGLKVLAENINNNNNNHTRFIVIGRNLEVNEESNKISIVFSAPHKPGALYSALSHFAENSMNMLRIESRPIAEKSWEYFFYIDLEGNINDDRVKYVIEKIKENSMYFKLLGNYKKTT